MSILDQIQKRSSRAYRGGRKRAETIRTNRARGALFVELGQLCYEQRNGADGVAPEIARVMDAIGDMEAEMEMVGGSSIDLTDPDPVKQPNENQLN